MILYIILLFFLLTEPDVSETILILVSDYFYTFRFCWFYTLCSLVNMINNYFLFLEVMIKYLTAYPNNLICCFTSIILLYIVSKIIKIIL